MASTSHVHVILYEVVYCFTNSSTLALEQGSINVLLYLGTPKDRGLIAWREQMKLVSNKETDDLPNTYDFPVGMKFLRRYGQWQLLLLPYTYMGRIHFTSEAALL